MQRPPISSPDGEVAPQKITASSDTSEDELRAIATAQKMAVWAILLSLISLVLMMDNQPLPRASNPQAQTSVLIDGVRLVFAVLVAGTTFNLGRALRVQWAWLAGILAFLPLIGFIVLLGLNAQATTKLRAAGYKIGLLGVKGKI